MKIGTPSRTRRPPSLVPMIDVVMNLLFFFMLATTFAALAPQALAVALAGGSASSSAPSVTPTLRVAPKGLALDGQAMDWATVLARLKAQPAPSVVVEPAPDLAAPPLLDALLKLREAGVSARLARAETGRR